MPSVRHQDVWLSAYWDSQISNWLLYTFKGLKIYNSTNKIPGTQFLKKKKTPLFYQELLVPRKSFLCCILDLNIIILDIPLLSHNNVNCFLTIYNTSIISIVHAELPFQHSALYFSYVSLFSNFIPRTRFRWLLSLNVKWTLIAFRYFL